MTTYHFTGAIAYDLLGSALRIAPNVESKSVTDPSTGLIPPGLAQDGQPVEVLRSDDKGRYSFEAEIPGVTVDWGAGPNTLYADEVPALAVGLGTTIDGGTPSDTGSGEDIDGGVIS